MRLGSISEANLLLMWVSLLVILAVARGLGVASRRLGQPAVVGELLAGVVLGPSLLGKLWPAAESVLAPSGVAAAAPLNALGWLGVAFLLMITGFETDLRIVRRLGRPASAVAAAGLALPFAAGVALAVWLPAGYVGGHGSRIAFLLFIGVSLSISSLPVIAKILGELGLMRRDFGQLTVAVGMVNDLVGWLALGVIAALAQAATLRVGSVAIPILAIAAILLFAFTLGQRIVDAALARLRRSEAGSVETLTVAVLVMLAFAALTQYARSDAVLGAYIAGILIGRSKYAQQRMRGQLEAITMAVFAPLFFATAGLRMNLAALASPHAAAWAGAVLAVAVVSKLAGVYFGARFAGLGRREGLALGVGLNSRGAVEVVIATVGLDLGVLSVTAYTAIVAMAIITSAVAPPLLRRVVGDWRGSPDEQARLDHEEALERNLLIRPGRVLLPSRGGTGSVAAARLVAAAWPPEAPVTVLAAADAGDMTDVLGALEGQDVELRELRELRPGDAVQAILEEAKLGYTAIALGAQEGQSAEALLSPVVDELLAASPLPLVIVRRGRGRYTGVQQPRCVLVPVAGTPASRTAQEVAYALARARGTEVVLTHVVNRPGRGREVYPGAPVRAAALSTAASGVVEQAAAHAREHDVSARTCVRTGSATAEEILAAAASAPAQFIVLGTTIRRLEDRSFLGHTVEHVIDHAEQAVVVVATPDRLFAEGIAERLE
ncbi:MAG: cation:proton antiporter domain-containing protein [Mycobacteriales bacterium]